MFTTALVLVAVASLLTGACIGLLAASLMSAAAQAEAHADGVDRGISRGIEIATGTGHFDGRPHHHG